MILSPLLQTIQDRYNLTYSDILTPVTDEAIICKQIVLERLLESGVSEEGCTELLGCVIFPIELTSKYEIIKNEIALLIPSKAIAKL